MRRWGTEGRLWTSPDGANDDWFWIFASVFHHDDVDEDVNDYASGDVAEALEGTTAESSARGSERGVQEKQGPMEVVTNDQMRDHW